MKSLALLSLLIASVTAAGVGSPLGWTAPSQSPSSSLNTQALVLSDSIASATPTVTPVDDQTPNAPTPPPRVDPPSTTSVPVPTTVTPSTSPISPLPQTTATPVATDPQPPSPSSSEQAANAPTPTSETLVSSTPPSPPQPTPTTAPPNRAVPTPKPTTYVPPSIPEASADSTTFKLVAPVACDETFVKTIEAIYSKNRDLFHTCANDSAYQIFPYSGTRPTPTQIHALATSKPCAALFTTVVNSDLPECNVSDISVRSVVETLLKITMDVVRGHESPDTDRFHAMCIWRRNSNLAKAVGVPYDKDSVLYAEYARDLPEALARSDVQGERDASNEQSTIKGGSMQYAAGTVHGNSDSSRDRANDTTVNVRNPQSAVGGAPSLISHAVLVVSIVTFQLIV